MVRGTRWIRTPLLAAFVALVAVIVMTGGGPAASSEPEGKQLLPNMKALPAMDIHIHSPPNSDTKLLRFTTISWNAGDGPLELRPGQAKEEEQLVYQAIHRTTGEPDLVKAGWFVWHDGHNHYHFDDYALYLLEPVDAPGDPEGLSSKTSFCIMDTDAIDLELEGAPPQRHYTKCNKDDPQGISVGWGDKYSYHLADQSFDVTGFPAGLYELTIVVDPDERLVETDTSDNSSTVLIYMDPETGTVLLDGATPTPVPTKELVWGDSDCGGVVGIGDAIRTARYLLDLDVTPVEDCPPLGAEVTAAGEKRQWGDVDCDGKLGISDALRIARHLIGLNTDKPDGCPPLGDLVPVVG